MLLRRTAVTVRPLGEGYLVALSDEYDYPGEWQDDRSIQATGECAAQISCVTDTGDLDLRMELHDHAPGPDTSRAWHYGPEDVALKAEAENLVLVIPCQGDLSEQSVELPLAAPSGADDHAGRFHVRLYGRADSNEPGIGDRGERHLIQLWPATEQPPDPAP